MTNELVYEGGRLLKMEVDYSNTVDEKIPICQQLAKVCIKSFYFNLIKSNLKLILFIFTKRAEN